MLNCVKEEVWKKQKEFKARERVCQGRYVWQCMSSDPSYCGKYPVGHDYFESYWELMNGYAKDSGFVPPSKPEKTPKEEPKKDQPEPKKDQPKEEPAKKEEEPNKTEEPAPSKPASDENKSWYNEPDASYLIDLMN
jgi:hypothetical protein